MDCSFLNDLKDRHLIVAGEVGIDEYIWGDTYRISPEGPVPIVEVESQDYKLGLAANVAQNIVSLGSKCTLISVRGEDSDGEKLSEMIQKAGIQQSILVEDASRPTLRKVRIIAKKQHVVRVDYERSHVLDASVAKLFRESICDLLPKSDGIIIQDYGKGLWKADVISFIKQAKQLKKPVFVDPSRLSPLNRYKGVTLMSPNSQEAECLLGLTLKSKKLTGKDDDRLFKMAKKILEITESEAVVITCGSYGMVSLEKGDTELQRIPTFARDIFDVTGAGDTVIAVLALVKVLGQPLSTCMRVANVAAGIVVGKMGTACVNQTQLISAVEEIDETGILGS